MSVIRLVGWSCIAYAFMVLARIGVAFAAQVPTHAPTRSARRSDGGRRGRISAAKRFAAFAD